MKNWEKALIKPMCSIREAIEAIDANSLQIVLVVNEKKHLLGTVTDGDIRRGILKGISLDESVQMVMNRTPMITGVNETRQSMLSIMKSRGIRQIPVVDHEGCVEGIEILDEMIQGCKRDNSVIIMAGGLGSRLRPLTDDCPKSLLRIGAKPILEIILANFIEYGFRKFYLAVNYKHEMIEEYFGDGSKLGVEIDYLREDKKLGTVGALGLLNQKFSQPILVMNGDLLTNINFEHLLNYHMEHNADATICVRDYHFQIPYGVVKIEKDRLVGIEEKPSHHFFVNAGVYVFKPEVLEFIPKNQVFDMPQLFERLLELKKETVVFPIREYWLDVGHIDDFERANGEYNKYFIE
jgi:dTDP-glucose pyrophosphorylase